MNQLLSKEWTTNKEAALALCAEEGVSVRLETILFVEDEAFVRAVTGEILRSAGYQVFVAKDAAEGLRIYEAHSSEIDLLLTDVVLPGETGCALAARLRRGSPALKVLYATGYAEQMETGAVANEDCLAKPFSSEVLLRRVRRLLDWGQIPAVRGNGATLLCGGA